MNTKFAYILLLFIILESCSRIEKNDVTHIPKPVFSNNSFLKSDSIKIDVIIDPWNWKVDKEQISILSGNNMDKFLYSFSLPDFTLLYKYGTMGRGPGEFLAVNWLNSVNDARLGLYDIPKRRIYSYITGKDTLYLKDSYELYSVDGKLCRPYTTIQEINDSLFLLKADQRNETILEVLNVNTMEIIQNFTSVLKRNPDVIYTKYFFDIAYNRGNRIIFAYQYIDRLEFFSLDSTNMIKPELVIGSDEEQIKEKDIQKLVTYYTDIKCTDNYIFALYQGSVEHSEIKSVIEIYKLDGTPVKRLILDQFIRLFAIDPYRNCIYGYNPAKGFDYVFIFKNIDMDHL